MPDPQLPPEVLAWPGFAGSPPPFEGSLPGPPPEPPPFAVPVAPGPPVGLLPPEVLQALPSIGGAAPAPPAEPAPPVAPGPGSRADYKVPVSAFRPPQAPSSAATPQRGTPLQQIQAGGDQQQAAVGRQADIARAQGGVAAQQASEEADLLKQEVDERAKFDKETADRLADQAKTRAGYQSAVNQAVETGANYKVDPNRYYKNLSTGKKISNAISIVLSSVGQAMMGNHGPNVALEMIQQAAKDDVDAQVREQEHLGKEVGVRQGQLRDYVTMTGDVNSAANLMQAQHLTTAAAAMRATAAKYGSPNAKLAAEHTALGLEANAGALKSSVAEKLSDVAIKKQELANQGYGLSLQKRSQDLEQGRFEKTFSFNQKKEMDEIAEKYAALAQKDKAAKAKQIGDEGIFSPSTGDPLYTERGKEMVSQAGQYEAAARTAGDPATAQKLTQQAADLRLEAKATEVATVHDEVSRRKIQEQIGYAQEIVDTGAEIRSFLNSDPASWDREGWAKAKTRYGALVGDYIKTLGANASSREFDAITKEVLTFDPDSITSRLPLIGRKAPAASSLEILDELVKAHVDTMLKSHHIKDGWVPRAAGESPETTFGGQTAQEVGAGSGLSGLQKADLRLQYPVSGYDEAATKQQERQVDAGRQAAESRTSSPIANSSNYGLAPGDDDAARSLVQSAKSASNEDRSRIADTLAQPLLNGPKFDPNNENASPYGARPSLGSGIIHLIRDEDPQLYKEVLAKLPRYQAEAITQFDNIFGPDGKVRAKK